MERSKVGCRPLKVDSALTRAADDHASDMVRRHYFSHTGADGSSFSDRTSRAGYGGFATAENIAAGQPTAEAVVRSWMQSPGHRMNIVNCAYNRIGVGYDAGSVGSGYGGGSWVQDFGIS
ncbi:CAP domain-containing protein [Luteipulveratus sp. YIM 133132]|uniref:CAP domain-containing protein n=1 Tax=Luteipulveratus flavus TaxID=3031728 RepID=UPI0023B0EA00|nr:CAP domain-containing protein [Luteipulveratus sp. YIM 133132]MDE9366170.1 CAP domain-containing protein [Luteipulveratus sp. YIM 133132]